MTDAPERIWMDPDIKFPECEKQYGCDVEYIRKDVSDALVAAAREAALREAMAVADAAMKKYAAATYSKEPVKVFNAGDDQPSQSAAKCYCAGEIYQEIEALIERDQ